MPEPREGVPVDQHGGGLADEVDAEVVEQRALHLLRRHEGDLAEQTVQRVLERERVLVAHVEPVVVELKGTAAHHERAVGPAGAQQGLDAGRRDHVVLEHELEPAAPGEGDAAVPVGYQAEVVGVSLDADPRVARAEALDHRERFVRRAVVHDEHLEVAERLRDDALEALLDVTRTVEGRHADAHHRVSHRAAPCARAGGRGRRCES